VDLKLIRSNRKSLAIEIKSNGEVVVRSPIFATDYHIHSFIAKNKKWIENKLLLVEKRANELNIQKEGESGVYYFFGIAYVLEFRDTFPKTKVSLIDGKLALNSIHKGDLNNVLLKYYKKIAREVFSERVALYSERLAISAPLIKLSSARKRWGSCSTRGNINLSWRLIKTPDFAIDYVVVHELCHLFHFNHSPAFYKLIESILPDYRQREIWLEKNGGILLNGL